jgi:AcrR family transcriptional regulator
MTPRSAALRSDAARNRERILAAAEQVFAERGLDASTEEIARAAGVGIATVYRRFPTRGELVEATLQRKMAAYAAALERAAADPDAWRGFCGLVTDLCQLQAADAGLKDLLALGAHRAPAKGSPAAHARADLELLVRRAQEQGSLRPDFVVADLSMLLLANAGVVTATHCTVPDAWRRFAAYMIDAFRTPPPGCPEGELPPPPDRERLGEALGRATS